MLSGQFTHMRVNWPLSDDELFCLLSLAAGSDACLIKEPCGLCPLPGQRVSKKEGAASRQRRMRYGDNRQ